MKWAAPIAFAIYLALGLALGDRFPFSRYDMYAGSARRDQGAVPLVLADGAPTEIRRWDRFAGLDGPLVPEDVPTSLGYLVVETERWIAAHRAPDGSPPGPVKLQIAVKWIAVEKGVVRERTRIVAEGTAWPR